MPHITITVDGKSLMDANTDHGRGANNMPSDLAAYLQPGARPEPWMKAVLFSISEAVQNGQDLSAAITTKAQGWVLDVDMTPRHYATRDDIWDPRNPYPAQAPSQFVIDTDGQAVAEYPPPGADQ